MTDFTKPITKPITKTIRVRVKDKHANSLRIMAFGVNQIWNAANALSAEYGWIPIPEVGFVSLAVSEFDLQKELKGIRHERSLNIPAASVQAVISQHARSRKQFKRNKLRWRASSGSKRALGWVPFKTSSVKVINGQIRFNGHVFGVWDSYGLSKLALRTGSFSEDSRGRWYFNATVDYETSPSQGTSSIGIDLGLKTVATCSDGVMLENARIVNNAAAKLAIAQRGNKKARVKALHAQIKNRRKDAMHKFTSMLVDRHGAIFVGDVSSVKLTKTTMAKSVLDAGWGMLKTQLEYKAMARSVVFAEVNENYTTQTCSCCGCISSNSPKGRIGLGIREWTCARCGAMHDRDVNAARNILAQGHLRLAAGITAIPAQSGSRLG